MKLHEKIYRVVEGDSQNGKRVSTSFNKIILIIILISVVGAVLETEHSIYIERAAVFDVFSTVVGVVFLVEYLLRLYASKANPNPLFPRVRSGHRLFQRPSPPKQIPSNNKLKSALALLLPAFAVFTDFTHGATLFQLDFGNASTVSQPGWQTLGGTGSPSGAFSGFTGLSDGNITVSLTNITFDRLYKNGTGAPDDFPGTDLDNMYSDLLFRNNTGTPITITIGGLKAGTYTFTTHHLNAVNTPSRFNLDVQDADSPAFGQSAAADIAMGLGLGAPLTPESFNPTVISFEVESNGTDPIILRMTDTFIGTGGNTGGWWGINGLEIIPEPSTALLGALGMLALLRRRR